MRRRKRKNPVARASAFLAVVLAPIIIVLAAAQTGPDRKPAADPPSVTQAATIAAPATWDTPEPTDAPEVPQDAQETPEPEPEWIEFAATAYCPCEVCCGSWALNRPNGIVYTASGAVAQEGVTIAADWDVLPAGTVVYIDGLGERVVQDRGSAVKGNAIDVYFPDHQTALQFGRQTVRLYVVKGAEP